MGKPFVSRGSAALSLDPYTIIAYTAGVLALISVLFVLFWANEGRDRRLSWFIVPLCSGTCGAVLLAAPSTLPGRLSLQVGTWFILLAYGLGWQAMRALYVRPPVLACLAIPPTLWLLLAVAVFDPCNFTGWNAFVRTLIVACFQGLAAYELWRGRNETLPARVALFWIFSGYAVYTAIRLPFVGYLPMPLGGLPTKVWAVIVYNVTVVMQVFLAGSFMIVLSKERIALKHYKMAMLDPLTGVGNRRAFSEAGATRISSRDEQPVTLLLIDIDHFKSVNDRFGHDIGDEVIKLAARTAADIVKNQGNVFRMGGEEFACLLPRLQPKEAHFLAERLRTTFKKSAAEVAGYAVNATLSIGVAASGRDRAELPEILSRADEALYEAKRSGRDRSVMAESVGDIQVEDNFISV